MLFTQYLYKKFYIFQQKTKYKKKHLISFWFQNVQFDFSTLIILHLLGFDSSFVIYFLQAVLNKLN